MKLLSIAGARPNFVKLASIASAVDSHNQTYQKNPLSERINHVIVHTGQHYDIQMSQQFFEDLEIPKPDINLEVGSGSHAQQTAEIMKRIEQVLLKEQPDIMLVVGDVNSTVASALVASKIGYPNKRPLIVHVEAGLRSFDRTMPEEINRLLTDAISDLLFVTEKSAIKNLTNEGISINKIHFVGNVMIDTLKRHIKKSLNSKIKDKLKISAPYGIVTLHRPSNVDHYKNLELLINSISLVSEKLNLIFPVHPRTMANMHKFGLMEKIFMSKNITITEPLGYLDFLNLLKDSSLVITDSGGIQEETTFLNIPCITLRDNTERPITVDIGSNYLIGASPDKILPTVELILKGQGKNSNIPELWDGTTGDRIISILIKETKT
ncbi:MAG: UDP-N-acetylglucosamine 2-epimerase (non-hydrolyzing) [Desulfobacterales bacterium]|nr:UDP-N-acetylglucosamine 2-epimerase (non-hydrolyzing) [Desulfobacterales bacterium]